MKKALITGITGQDGSYLAELLIKKKYEVHGIIRRSSTFTTDRIEHIYKDPHQKDSQLYLHYADLTDTSSIHKIVREVQPHEVYNLGAQSHVKVSFDIPEYTANTDAIGTLRILEAIRNYSPQSKFYQASSSEIFGKVQKIPQDENTPFYPRSPYGVSKLFSFWITVNYRESYNIFAVNGILFNHESERRGRTFVTRKITRGLARIKLGIDEKLFLGNLEAKRDWGYAKDYVEMMWRILQHNKPEDFVIATGETHSVREFTEEAARNLNIELIWEGKGLDEKGIDKKTGKVIIEIDPEYYRPAEVDLLQGNPKKAEAILGWKPKTTFKELVKIMTEFDLKNEKEHKYTY